MRAKSFNLLTGLLATALLPAPVGAVAASPSRLSGVPDSAWTTGGVVLRDTISNAYQMLAIPDGTGGAFVAFLDFRASKFDLYLHHVGALGHVLTFARQGAPVSIHPASEFFPRLALDGAGGVYVAWHDRRGGTGFFDVYASRFDAAGHLAPGWTVNGNRLGKCDGVNYPLSGGYQASMTAVADGSGGLIATWTDARNGQLDVFAQHVLSDGSLAPGWPVDGLAICSADSAQHFPRAVADGTGGAFVVWEDRRGGDWDLYAIRIQGDGSLAIGWPENGVPMAIAPGDQLIAPYASVLADATGGGFVTWADSRSSAGGIYVSRLRGDGTRPPGVPDSGVALGATDGLEQLAEAVPDGAGGAVVGWSGQHDEGPQLRAARVDSSGALAPGWPPGGTVLASMPSVVPFHMSPDGMGGAYFTRLESHTSSNDTLRLHRVAPDGSIAPGFPVGGLDAAHTLISPNEPSPVSDGATGVILIWSRYATGAAASTRILASHWLADATVPALLSLVSSDVKANSVQLTWWTADPGLARFIVERRQGADPWRPLTAPMSSVSGLLQFVDREVAPGARYGYRLAEAERPDSPVSEEVWVELPEAIETRWLGAEAGPEGTSIALRFALRASGPVSLALFDAAGRKLAGRSGFLEAGEHRDELRMPQRLAPGIYWLQLQSGEVSMSRRLIHRP
ncbi:MAG: hypothetical protein ABIS67_03880 [Candidatus Eisenbacteria bacterium]